MIQCEVQIQKPKEECIQAEVATVKTSQRMDVTTLNELSMMTDVIFLDTFRLYSTLR